jgi:hypothetical protein
MRGQPARSTRFRRTFPRLARGFRGEHALASIQRDLRRGCERWQGVQILQAFRIVGPSQRSTSHARYRYFLDCFPLHAIAAGTGGILCNCHNTKTRKNQNWRQEIGTPELAARTAHLHRASPQVASYGPVRTKKRRPLQAALSGGGGNRTRSACSASPLPTSANSRE